VTERERAPAKLNLALELLGIDARGYHDLRSVMISLELADTVELESGGEAVATPAIRLSMRGGEPDIPLDERNLVVRAARAFIEEAGGLWPGELRLRLVKRVPSQAGLGGGSSDAAAVLRLLARLRPLPRPRLLAVAERLGSDVPFMVDGGGALAEGRGERLISLRVPTAWWAVLVQPAERISTAWCYQRYDELVGWSAGSRKASPGEAVDGLARALQAGDLAGVAAHLYNDLERPVFDRYPHLADLSRRLVEAGCAGALMTGSGSCFFGLAPTRAAARDVARAARGSGRVWITRTWREAK
jgi:4-diphosphocytidyl-2-C-methyl-D-erythritol kinase